MTRNLSLLITAVLAVAAASPSVVLTAKGVRTAGKGGTVAFGTAQSETLRRLVPVFGKQIRTQKIPDCGQGMAMTEVAFRNGVTLTFAKGKFSGWDLDKAGISTERGLKIGASREALLRAYPKTEVDESSLGVMFSTGSAIAGFLNADIDDARIENIHAGSVCKIS